MFGGSQIEYKSVPQIQLMRKAGLVVAKALELLRERAQPGISTAELDKIAEEFIRDSGAEPSFLGYGSPPFPGSICSSINDEVVHGVPSDRVLLDGDLLSIDCGAIVNGWHGDAAISLLIGAHNEKTEQRQNLLKITEEALWEGIAALKIGGRLNSVGCSIDDFVSSQDSHYGIVEDYVGHGIGTAMHQDPAIPNYRVRNKGIKLRAGLVVAIEPMITLGSSDTVVDSDQWTVRTQDQCDSAHFEHTVAITDAGLWVLTALDGGQEQLSARGVPCADAVYS